LSLLNFVQGIAAPRSSKTREKWRIVNVNDERSVSGRTRKSGKGENSKEKRQEYQEADLIEKVATAHADVSSLLGCSAASACSLLPTFQDSMSVPS
jgi:hypothetical protein